MEHRRKWDALSVAALILCVGPEAMTSLKIGLPSDLFWWEWFTVVPIAALMLGAPQLAMFAFIRASRSKPLRVIYFATSVAMLVVYYHFLRSADLTSSSTAAVGLFFFSFYMALISAAAAGLLFGMHRILVRNRE